MNDDNDDLVDSLLPCLCNEFPDEEELASNCCKACGRQLVVWLSLNEDAAPAP